MTIALLYVIAKEELDSGNSLPSLLHSYTGGRCWLNIAMQSSVTDALGEEGITVSLMLSTNRKGTWTEKETQINDGSRIQ